MAFSSPDVPVMQPQQLLWFRGAMQRYFLHVALLLLSLQDRLWLAVLLSPAIHVCCVLHGLSFRTDIAWLSNSVLRFDLGNFRLT
jgi:hypothetical protein